MIDPRTESLIPLSDAPRHPLLRRGRRPGRPIHRATLERWMTRGVSGVRLESLKLGGIRMTSEEALVRFLERVSDPHATPDSATPSMAATAHARAERELAAEGL
jgi:hypothetical protein